MAVPVVLLLGAAGLIALIAQCDVWTRPGPTRDRGLRRVRIIGAAAVALTVAVAVTAGVLEGVFSTAESDASEFGVGYVFIFVSIGWPLAATALTICWLTVTTGENRVRSAIGRGVVTGLIAFGSLLFVASLLADTFHA